MDTLAPPLTDTELPAVMTIYTASETKTRLLNLVASQPSPSINLSHVAEFDTVGVQCLVLARREALRVGKSFVLSEQSSCVDEALALYGISNEFCLR